MSRSETQSKWSELPSDVLIRFAKLLSTTNTPITFSCTIQILLFRAVCKSWRSALPLDNARVFTHNPIPISAPPPFYFAASHSDSSKYYRLARFHNGAFYFVRSTACILQSIKNPSCSRLLIVDHLSDDFSKVCCRKPLFTSYDRSDCWDISAPRCLNLLDYRVSVVAEEYSLRFLMNDKGVLRLQDSGEMFWRKAVLIWNMESDEELDGVAIVLFGNDILRQYSFADCKWTEVNVSDGRGFGLSYYCHDLVRYNDECVVAINHKAVIFVLSYDFDSRTFGCTAVGTELKYLLDCRRLVVNSDTGELCLVEKNAFRDEFGRLKASFVIRRFSENLKNWVKGHGSHGWIMFVGCGFTFSAIGEHFPTVCSGNGNCMFTSIGSFRRFEYSDEDEVFVDIADDRCVFHFGEFCADSISNTNFTWCTNDYNPIFSSPEKWEELNQPLLEQPAVPMSESKSGTNPGEDVNIGSSDHSESNYNSRHPKTRKITNDRPSTEHIGTKEAQLELIQKLVECVTGLVRNPVCDQPGCSFREVVQDLDSLPNVEVASEFYFSSCSLLQKVENREAYMSLGCADVKYKWLSFMLNRSG